MIKTEAKVGFFLFLGILFLFFLTTQVKEFGTFNKKGYLIHTKMVSVTGLEINSKVRVNGLVAGFVKDMDISGESVKIDIFIYQNFSIPNKSTVKLTQSSMIGGKYLEITLVKSMDNLREGEFLKSAKKLLGFEEASNSMSLAADEFKKFIVEARELLDKKSRDDLKKTFANLEQITDELKQFVDSDKFDRTLNDISDAGKSVTEAGEKFGNMSDEFAKSGKTINKRLDKIMEQIESLTKEFDVAGKSINEKLPDILEKFSLIEDDVRDILKENKKPLNDTLTNASGFFKSGDDTFTKIDNYLEALGKSQLEVGISQIYQLSDSYGKSKFSINYMPNPSRYYMLDILSTDDYSQSDENGDLIYPKLHDDSDTLFSAQIGKRYDDMVFRVGIIENSGGAGVDYFLQKDRLKLSGEIYDFNAKNDLRNSNPHAKIEARYTVFKHIDGYLGYDNFLNSDADNLNIGIGIHFVDDDLKQLIGAMGLGSLAK